MSLFEEKNCVIYLLNNINFFLICFFVKKKHFTEFLKMMKKKMESSILENHSLILIPWVYIERQHMNLGLEHGRRYIYEFIHGHKVHCYNVIRMYPWVYIQLSEKLWDDYQLKEADDVRIEESVAIFLNIFSQNTTPRYVGKIFGHSQEAITRKFHEVLSSLKKMAVHFLRPCPYELTQPHQNLQSNRTVQSTEHMFLSLLRENIQKNIGTGKVTRVWIF